MCAVAVGAQQPPIIINPQQPPVEGPVNPSSKTPIVIQEKMIKTLVPKDISSKLARLFLAMRSEKMWECHVPYLKKEVAKFSLLGALGGGFLGSLYSPIGTWIGAATGAVVAPTTYVAYKVYTFNRSSAFRKWCSNQIREKIITDFFLDFVKNSSEYHDFQCPIALDYPVEVANIGDKRYYEKEKIVAWIKSKGSSQLSPAGAEKADKTPFTLKDVKDDADHYFIRMIDVLKEIRKTVLNSMPNAQIVQEGLGALCANVVQDFDSRLNLQRQRVLGELAIGRITAGNAQTELDLITAIQVQIAQAAG